MIKIAIVEDEAMYAKQLEEFLRQYEKENSYRLEMQQRDAQGKGYTACLICGGDLDETYGDS